MKPKANQIQCETLAWLLDDGHWHMKCNLQMNERMIRAACAEQPDRFMSSQSGYKLVEFATIREIEISVADLRSRIKHLTRRAQALEDAKYIRSKGVSEITEQRQMFALPGFLRSRP